MRKAQGSGLLFILAVLLLIMLVFPGTLNLDAFSTFISGALTSGLPGILLLLLVAYLLLAGASGGGQIMGSMTGGTLFLVGLVFFLLGSFVTDFRVSHFGFMSSSFLNTLVVMVLFFFVCIYVFARDLARIQLF
jgi:hypothetical protein